MLDSGLHRLIFIPLVAAVFLLLPESASALCLRMECQCTPVEPQSVNLLKRAKCVFKKRERLEFEANHFPDYLARVEIEGGNQLKLGAAVFGRHPYLELVAIRNVTKVFVQKGSFANMTANSMVRFEFTDATSLVLETQSFRNSRGPVSVLIARVTQVIVQKAAFGWLSDLTINAVSKLELLDEAFLLENPKNREPSTSITLKNVVMENLGRGTFHSSVAEVHIIGSEVKRVKSDAFNAVYLGTILIENSTLHKVEARAFAGRTLVDTLRLSNVKLHELFSNAVQSGLSNLVIDRSRLGTVHEGGVNITVAAVTLTNNNFSRVFKRGLIFKKWNIMRISNNTFKLLDAEAFSAPFQTHANKPATGPEFNFTRNLLYDVSSNAFDVDLKEELTADIQENVFAFKCHCDMEKAVKKIATGLDSLTDTLYYSSLCLVDPMLSQCFQLPLGFVNMWNFSELVCDTEKKIVCEEVQRDAAIPPHIPSITSAVDIIFEEDIERDRRLLGLVFVIAVCGMLVMMAMSGFMWLRRKGYCTKARLMLLPSTNSLINLLARVFSGSAMTPTGSAHSISRLSVHEYAELQRKMEEGTAEEDAPQEDKATQTLPEELTQELLQSLRDKLDDPDNYKEARDMIEHLYDLIKVEESCNKNYHNDSTSINLEELDAGVNLYDVIQPKKRCDQSKPTKNMVTTGTRAPSPDKLLPVDPKRNFPTMVCEYIEPRDRQVHLYSELPEKQENVLCDYGEPNDSKVHVYTELPPACKMANRPLPSKPDQHSAGGPSTS